MPEAWGQLLGPYSYPLYAHTWIYPQRAPCPAVYSTGGSGLVVALLLPSFRPLCSSINGD
jgi:hypothetical protein